MRHEQLQKEGSYAKVDVQAVWPASAQIAPLPIPDLDDILNRHAFQATLAAPDVPAAVGKLIILSYVALVASFAIATVATAYSAYVVTIAMLFLVAYFAVPVVMLRQEPQKGERCSLQDFLRDGMNTLTGHSTGAEALVQMLIVPVFLTFGALCMGIAAAIIM